MHGGRACTPAPAAEKDLPKRAISHPTGSVQWYLCTKIVVRRITGQAGAVVLQPKL